MSHNHTQTSRSEAEAEKIAARRAAQERARQEAEELGPKAFARKPAGWQIGD